MTKWEDIQRGMNNIEFLTIKSISLEIFFWPLGFFLLVPVQMRRWGWGWSLSFCLPDRGTQGIGALILGFSVQRKREGSSSVGCQAWIRLEDTEDNLLWFCTFPPCLSISTASSVLLWLWQIDKELAGWFCREGLISFPVWPSSSICDSLDSIFPDFVSSWLFQHLPGPSPGWSQVLLGHCPRKPCSSPEDWCCLRVILPDAGWTSHRCSLWAPTLCKAQAWEESGKEGSS